MSIPDSDDFDLGTGEFTIDFWVYFDSLPSSQEFFFNQRVDGVNAHELSIDGSLSLKWAAYEGSELFDMIRTLTINTNIWHHITLVRKDNELMMYLDGQQQGGNHSFSGTMPSLAGPLDIARWSGESLYLNAYMDELRISKGIARWTSDFTPDTTPYSISGDTGGTLPIYTNFSDDSGTTNFSDSNVVPDITNVTNITLAISGKGKIKFGESTGINADGEDYNTNIVIEDEFISVNTAALDQSFNTSATITLEGVTCPVDTISYAEGTFATKADIIANGRNCELDGVCSNKQCSAGTLTFDVAHFTGFAAGSNANLTIQAEAGIKYANDPIEFTAEYINSTSGVPISGECNISFDDDWGTWYAMTFDSTDYNYTKASGFATTGTHDYNVTCSGTGYVTLMANDTKFVSSVDIPEFGTMTLGLGLIAVLIGIIVVRKRKL